MNKFYINTSAKLMLICALAFSCIEGPDQVEPEIDLYQSHAPFGEVIPDGKGPLSTVYSDTIYIEWKPFILNPKKDSIRANYSDPNGTIYLDNYDICPITQSIEKWIIRRGPDEDQTPDPLVVLHDNEDEMERATYTNICL